MKAVFENKVYNTETATLVYHWDNGRSWGDYGYNFTDFYITKKGNWFKVYLQWHRAANNSWYEEAICPIEEEEALELMQHLGAVEEVETYFSDKLEEA